MVQTDANVLTKMNDHLFEFTDSDVYKAKDTMYDWVYSKVQGYIKEDIMLNMPCGSICKVLGRIRLDDSMFDHLSMHKNLIQMIHECAKFIYGLVVEYKNFVCILPPVVHSLEVYDSEARDTEPFGFIIDLSLVSVLSLTSVKAQGYTMDKVKYQVPKCLDTSPLKSSVYVVMTRVRNQADIELSANILERTSTKRIMESSVVSLLHNIITNKHTCLLY